MCGRGCESTAKRIWWVWSYVHPLWRPSDSPSIPPPPPRFLKGDSGSRRFQRLGKKGLQKEFRIPFGTGLDLLITEYWFEELCLSFPWTTFWSCLQVDYSDHHGNNSPAAFRNCVCLRCFMHQLINVVCSYILAVFNCLSWMLFWWWVCWQENDQLILIDGNKSLYLVFVGVVFLSILDCF
jgi:hypothetical protein